VIYGAVSDRLLALTDINGGLRLKTAEERHETAGSEAEERHETAEGVGSEAEWTLSCAPAVEAAYFATGIPKSRWETLNQVRNNQKAMESNRKAQYDTVVRSKNTSDLSVACDSMLHDVR